MSNKEIKALELDIFANGCTLQEKHELFNLKLETLNEELRHAFDSDDKLRIMNEMNKIEKEIKSNLDYIKNKIGFNSR